ncbi:hypothetical protein BH23GEM10_BH23GEM10_10270 [soil metagenome]
MRGRALVLILLATASATPAQAQHDSAARRAALQAYRDSLETEVVHKFVARLSRDLRLNSAQRTTVEQVIRSGAERRRELMRASGELQGRLIRAVRSDDTSSDEFQRLLANHEALRRREHDSWTHDQQQLAAVLNPRQRAHFLLSWTHFQETLREIMSRRPDRDDDDGHRRDKEGHRH